jgi:hypothetical protein
MKMQKKRLARNTRFRPSSTGACEAQLRTFTGPPKVLHVDNSQEVHWVAGESLDAALHYLRQRYADFIITEARFRGMVAFLSGSPLD